MSYEDPYQPSAFRQFMGGLMEDIGYVLDTPGALTRGFLSGRPFERRSAEELADDWGIAKHGTLSPLGAFGLTLATDPLMVLPGVGLASKGVKALSGIGKAAKTASSLSSAAEAGASAAKSAFTLGDASHALGLGLPVAGGAVLAGNEDNDPVMNALGYGMMAAGFAPLGMSAAKFAGRKLAPTAKALIADESGAVGLPKSGTVAGMKRSTKYGVGKDIGGKVYVHRAYEDVFGPDVAAAKARLPEGADYHVVRYEPKTGSVAFIESPDFDTAHEPTVTGSTVVNRDGTVSRSKMPSDPQIYHHKWLWVKDDYPGFDVAESKRRTELWKGLSDVNPSKIGYKSYWEQNVVPRIEALMREQAGAVPSDPVVAFIQKSAPVTQSEIDDAVRKRILRSGQQSGAVLENAIVPKRYVPVELERLVSERGGAEKVYVLDAGSGKHAKHAIDLRNSGYNVDAIDLPENMVEGVHNPDAYTKGHDIAYSSRVLNTMPSKAVMDEFIGNISRSLHPDGAYVANVPNDPLLGAWRVGEAEKGKLLGDPVRRQILSDVLSNHFHDIEFKVKGGSPVVVARRPKVPFGGQQAQQSGTGIKTYALGALPVLGGGLAMNSDDPMMRDIGLGMAALGSVPLAMALGKGAAGLAGAARKTPFFSRLEEAIKSAPESFASRAEQVRERIIPGKVITNPKTGEVIKTIPDRVVRETIPASSASDQLMGYLNERAHPQEIEWVLGDQFADADKITRDALMDAYSKGKIDLDVVRHGGEKQLVGYRPGIKYRSGRVDGVIGDSLFEMDSALDRAAFNVSAPTSSRQEAARTALDTAKLYTDQHVTPVVKAIRTPVNGPLRFPDMLVPGGKDATEVPIRLNVKKGLSLTPEEKATMQRLEQHEQAGTLSKQDMSLLAMLSRKLNQGSKPFFRDDKGHFGDDVVAWLVHDRRQMPDGKYATFMQEGQSDLHQLGQKAGYNKSRLAKSPYIKQFDSEDELESFLRSSPEAWDGLIAPYEGKWVAWDTSKIERPIAFANGGRAPDAPFKSNEWMKLVIKQGISDAIDRGDDYFLMANGSLVSKTQGMPIEAARRQYDETLKNVINEMLKPHKAKAELFDLPGYKRVKSLKAGQHVWQTGDETGVASDGLVFGFGNGRDAKQLAKVVPAADGKFAVVDAQTGKLIRELSSADDARNVAYNIAAQEFERQHPATVSTEKVLGFKIPESMKKQVQTKGFPLMSLAPWLVGASGLGAGYNAIQNALREPQYE